MRLIDADALLQTVSIKSVFGNEINKMKCGELRKILEMIENAPTVEPPKMKGEWCFTPDNQLVCSCCYENPTNRIIVYGNLIYDMTPIRKRMKFCPNCGADMRGGQDE